MAEAKAAPKPADLEAREAELDEREAKVAELRESLAEQYVDMVEREQTLEARVTVLDEREAALTRTGTELALAEQRAARGTETDAGFTALPDPDPGNGFIIIEAPLPLVNVTANLHPSEHRPIARQTCGALREVLLQTGKMRNGPGGYPRPDEPADGEPAAAVPVLAILAISNPDGHADDA